MVAQLALRFEADLRASDQRVGVPVREWRWFQAAEVRPAPAPRPRTGRGFIRGIKDLITGIDVFADSVFDAVGVGKAIKEIKEPFGMSLDED